MASVFSRIISGEIPSFKIAEDDKHMAFLDISPLSKGHTLVVPKKEIDYVFDIESEDYIVLFSFTKKVASALKKSLACKRVCLVVLGFEVPHAHIHLIPSNSERDVNFNNPKLKFSNEEMLQIAKSISQNFE